MAEISLLCFYFDINNYDVKGQNWKEISTAAKSMFSPAASCLNNEVVIVTL